MFLTCVLISSRKLSTNSNLKPKIKQYSDHILHKLTFKIIPLLFLVEHNLLSQTQIRHSFIVYVMKSKA